MPRIHLDSLVKRYGQTEVIHAIDLTMEDNEFTVLVGPSGCGKSTTLRMIAGLETVSGGEIYIDERPVSLLEPKERDIAMVFQDYALYPHMNVAKNMSFALRLEKRPRAEINQKVTEVAARLGLSDYLHRKPAELSGGQRQRVAMGRALTRDASTFLFDEPLSNLDAKLRGQLRAELALMRQQVQKNMIYVTHDQIEAMTLGDRIVVMQDGYIRQQGTAETLFKEPASIFVAGFIGSPPMNLIQGSLQQHNDNLVFVASGIRLELPDDIAARAHANNNIDAVTLGIRPSDLVLVQSPDRAAPDNTDAAQTLSLQVLLSEYIGAQSILLTQSGEQQLRVELISADRVAPGETLLFKPRPGSIHLFDTTSENRI